MNCTHHAVRVDAHRPSASDAEQPSRTVAETSAGPPASEDAADSPQDERLRTLEAVGADVPALSAELHDATEQRREADRQLDEARREAETARESAASLERALVEARQRAVALERNAEQAREAMETAVAERDALAAALQAKDARLAELAAEGTSLEEALSAARAGAADTARRRDEADVEVCLLSRVCVLILHGLHVSSIRRRCCILALPGCCRSPTLHPTTYQLCSVCTNFCQHATPIVIILLAVAARGRRRGGSGGGAGGSRGGDRGARRARGAAERPCRGAERSHRRAAGDSRWRRRRGERRRQQRPCCPRQGPASGIQSSKPCRNTPPSLGAWELDKRLRAVVSAMEWEHCGGFSGRLHWECLVTTAIGV